MWIHGEIQPAYATGLTLGLAECNEIFQGQEVSAFIRSLDYFLHKNYLW